MPLSSKEKSQQKCSSLKETNKSSLDSLLEEQKTCYTEHYWAIGQHQNIYNSLDKLLFIFQKKFMWVHIHWKKTDIEVKS
jgi:hypothetical protein